MMYHDRLACLGQVKVFLRRRIDFKQSFYMTSASCHSVFNEPLCLHHVYEKKKLSLNFLYFLIDFSTLNTFSRLSISLMPRSSVECFIQFISVKSLKRLFLLQLHARVRFFSKKMMLRCCDPQIASLWNCGVSHYASWLLVENQTNVAC